MQDPMNVKEVEMSIFLKNELLLFTSLVQNKKLQGLRKISINLRDVSWALGPDLNPGPTACILLLYSPL